MLRKAFPKSKPSMFKLAKNRFKSAVAAASSAAAISSSVALSSSSSGTAVSIMIATSPVKISPAESVTVILIE